MCVCVEGDGNGVEGHETESQGFPSSVVIARTSATLHRKGQKEHNTEMRILDHLVGVRSKGVLSNVKLHKEFDSEKMECLYYSFH